MILRIIKWYLHKYTNYTLVDKIPVTTQGNNFVTTPITYESVFINTDIYKKLMLNHKQDSVTFFIK